VTQPNAATDRRVAGRLRLAAPQRGYPKPTWRVVVHEARLALDVARLLGGSRSILDDGAIEIVTDAATIEILLDGPDAIRIDWYHGARRCTEAEYAAPTDPAEVAARRRAARLGDGCMPRVWVWGHLAEAPDLGVVEFVSGNWHVAEDAARLAAMLRSRRDPLHVALGLVRSESTLASGRRILDTRPSLTTCLKCRRTAPPALSQRDRQAKKSA
jgi:hypothetical protein